MIEVDAAVITAIVGIISLLIVAAGGAYWLGRLSNRVDQLDAKFAQLDAKVDRLDAKVDRRFDELRNELLDEIRRGNQQLLLTLANHRHDTDGDPVFRVPVAAE